MQTLENDKGFNESEVRELVAFLITDQNLFKETFTKTKGEDNFDWVKDDYLNWTERYTTAQECAEGIKQDIIDRIGMYGYSFGQVDE